ncbi:hypothetical protein [Catellatospora methionotrophica]|uniref:hypothetical protein n=1 Tax=Catellatospora methionotrophica TaxID=121620 RepID=UPI0033D38CD6
MRPGTVRLLGTVLVGFALSATAACGKVTPAAGPGPAAPTGATATPATATAAVTGQAVPSAATSATTATGTPQNTACAAFAAAHQSGVAALAPVGAVLRRGGLSKQGLATATVDLNAAFTAMHTRVAAAAELSADPQLKAKISAYQLAIEQAIVAVEGSDSEQAKLQAALDSPAMAAAEKAVTAACA